MKELRCLKKSENLRYFISNKVNIQILKGEFKFSDSQRLQEGFCGCHLIASYSGSVHVCSHSDGTSAFRMTDKLTQQKVIIAPPFILNSRGTTIQLEPIYRKLAS